MIFSAKKHPHHSHQRHWVIWLTLLLGLIVDRINWPSDWALIIPNLTPLILFYWVIAIAQRNFVVTATVIGIAHDVLFHSNLGAYALIYLLLIYPLLHMRLQLRNTTLFQMSLIVGFWMLIHQGLIWLINLGKSPNGHELTFWLSALTATLLWPLLFISLRSLRKAMHVH